VVRGGLLIGFRDSRSIFWIVLVGLLLIPRDRLPNILNTKNMFDLSGPRRIVGGSEDGNSELVGRYRDVRMYRRYVKSLKVENRLKRRVRNSRCNIGYKLSSGRASSRAHNLLDGKLVLY